VKKHLTLLALIMFSVVGVVSVSSYVAILSQSPPEGFCGTQYAMIQSLLPLFMVSGLTSLYMAFKLNQQRVRYD